MSVTAKSNRAATCEQAIKNALIATTFTGQLMDEDSVHYLAFQCTLNLDRKFPAIGIKCAAPVPEGFLMPIRRVLVNMLVLTHIEDDEDRAQLARLVGAIETMIDAANTGTSTFATTYLPTGWTFGGFMQQDGGEPYVEDDYSAFPLQYEMEIAVA